MVPVVCVAVLGGWFILRPDKAQNANKDINYVQVSPSKRDVSNTLSGTGTLNPANTYNVKSLVAGKVLTSTIEEGDIVEEGTVLYTVDAPMLPPRPSRPPSPCSRHSAATIRPWTASMCVPRWQALWLH